MPKEMTSEQAETSLYGSLLQANSETIRPLDDAEAGRPARLIDGDLTPYLHGFSSLDEGYAAMAADEEREREAQEWCNAMIGDIPYEPW